VSISTEPTEVAEAPVDEAPVDEAPVEAVRPEWLPEKFDSAEAMAAAYTSLETRMGAEPESVVDEAAPIPPESTGVGTEALQPFYDEYAETGNLAEESFTALEGMGLSRDLVSAFMSGQKATHQAELGKIYQQAGGEQAYQAALGWAVQAMDPGEIQAFNQQVETGDMNTAMMAVKGLMAMHAQSGASGSNQPHLLQSEPTGASGAIYESLPQVLADMKTQAYKTDPAFRARVQQKISRSNVM
tara:strand:+ start:7602 stop:8330 length:729 start_codon:yes stop_codon:yes gene_type:complete